ncbi:hypothetical protein [Methylobacterium sp. J-068]|uniref:hypothetical protein n=1 Tax=Methylobacterium sp. J-068 TaxID=2836649 RepID=UPI001FBA74B2|nr:hypothetical protein [Methylobacterium sp. J-068]MCJ2034076.1 hypothetical protein [Methylobacterium sp. J-068]
MTATRLPASALAGALLLIGAGLASATAAPSLPDREPGKAPAITPVAAVTEAEDDAANCSRSRRRLWVEGEGWIVRRVTTCR